MGQIESTSRYLVIIADVANVVERKCSYIKGAVITEGGIEYNAVRNLMGWGKIDK